MTPTARREYVRAVRPRYTLAPWSAKRGILDEFCATTGYHRKYAIALLNRPQRPAEPAGWVSALKIYGLSDDGPVGPSRTARCL